MKRKIPTSYPEVTDADKEILHKVVDDGWYTEAKYCRKFAKELCRVSGKKHAILVNSGSSADFIALRVMLDHFPGRYVITCATSFPTTVAPIYQHCKVPIFIDIDPKTLSPNIGQLAYAIDKYGNDVAGVILTHMLGMPFDEALVREIIGEDRFFISDNCDAIGATTRGKPVGSWADMGTYSFFPAHHVFSGEGGAITTDDDVFAKDVVRYTNWGRDCHCMPGQSNVCGKRFEQKWGDLPHGFDHKYTFTRLGYNMKMTEFQGALGYSQIKRLDDIIDKRVKNYAYLFDKLEVFSPEYMELIKVLEEPYLTMSPFGFPIILSEKYSWTLTYLIRYLEENGIATRRMFGGNIIRQPAFRDLPYITMPDLDGADIMLWRTFWIGCHTLITRNDIDYIYNTINKFYIERGLF